ncbi:hypothetical protein ASPACDRAFT_1860055 [Aspergillus aculeatus ATCC 16872]|uniref:Mating-type alpha-pheromone receptor PreB n=1 Tax=Aspergillus aculeatus (strain ATCC 16872 / CBS 172.66 / WB 5094) TaxID=690307 RepID=A0A1L9WGY4_ASPA1|nr:uncharacterized protein ASPACDRAFT_1860055 [Aspergillus aculeatus ATCC 16872]OJJ95375.1 hypothetical protein ASPACDRAFT_1860055 [Aspergillus aculeatus ATCC 16872]
MSPEFEPFTQNITFHAADGTPFNVPVEAVDQFIQYCIRICINYGAQLGASIVLLVILLLLTRPEKRRSSVYLLNCSALLLNIGLLLCQALYFTSPFVHVYAYFGSDYSRVPQSTYANSVLGVVLATLLLISIEISLVLQVQVVCANLRRRYRRLLLGVSIVVALVPTGFRLGLMVENCKTIIQALTSAPLIWIQSAANITLTISICFFCTVFVTKLGYAIRQRRRLGVADFGPMKVIFVMGCQTLVVPALFSILHYAVNVPELSSNVLTLVTISLPLSSIWAGVALDHRSGNSNTNSNNLASSTSSRRNLWQVLSFSYFEDEKQPSHSACTTSTSTSASLPRGNKPGTGTGTGTGTTCYADPNQSCQQKHHQDLEMGYGIAVEHDISVRSVKREKVVL